MSTSVSKAKQYTTARIITDAWDLPTGFKAGDYVSVRFLRKAFGVLVYQCAKSTGETAAISAFELERFTL